MSRPAPASVWQCKWCGFSSPSLLDEVIHAKNKACSRKRKEWNKQQAAHKFVPVSYGCPTCNKSFKDNNWYYNKHVAGCAKEVNAGMAAQIQDPMEIDQFEEQKEHISDDHEFPGDNYGNGEDLENEMEEEEAKNDAPLPPPSPIQPADSPYDPTEASSNYLSIGMLAWAAKYQISANATSNLMVMIRKTLEYMAPDAAESFPKTILHAEKASSKMYTTAEGKDLYEATEPDLFCLCPRSDCGALYRWAQNGYWEGTERIKKGGYRIVYPDGSESEWIEGSLPYTCISNLAIHRQLPREIAKQVMEIVKKKEEEVKEEFNKALDARDQFYSQRHKLDQEGKESDRLRSRDTAPALPEQPDIQLRKLYPQCGTLMLKCGPIVGGRTRKQDVRPILMYPYSSIIQSIEKLLQRPGFEKKLEIWRNDYIDDKRKEFTAENRAKLVSEEFTIHHPKKSPLMSDIWLGRQWENHQYINGDTHQPCNKNDENAEKLLAGAGTLAFALNTDGYQATRDTMSTVSAIYMTILNLPRSERMLPHNCILVGLMPGKMSRTQHDACFGPLVTELNKLYEGVLLKTADHPEGVVRKGFLLTVVCDQPEARVTSGHVACGSKFGCAYCDREILSTRTNRNGHNLSSNYSVSGLGLTETVKSIIRDPSGANPLPSPLTDQNHIKYAREWAQSFTKQQRQLAAKTNSRGCRWTALMDLPYFRPVTGTTLDVMHNYFLGTVKAVMELFTLDTLRFISDEPAALPPGPAAAASSSSAAVLSNQSAARSTNTKKRAFSRIQDDDNDSNADDPDEALEEVESDTDNDEEEEDDEDEEEKEEEKNDTDDDAEIEAPEVLLAVSNQRKKAKVNNPFKPAEVNNPKKKSKVNNARRAERKKAILSEAHRKHVQRFVDSCSKSDVGRIPKKLVSMSNIKAQEWDNWISIFAFPALRSLLKLEKDEVPTDLTSDHLGLIKNMQKSAVLLKKYVISEDEVNELHQLLAQINIDIETLFTGNVVKSNLHLHLHLKEMILDYGPPSGWSCWSYERYNGLLSGTPMNYNYKELCTMRRFRQAQSIGGRMHHIIDAKRSVPPLSRPSSGPKLQDYEHILSMYSSHDVPLPSHPNLTNELDKALTKSIHQAGKKSVHYEWNSSPTVNGLDAYRQFCDRQIGRIDCVGDEVYPGQLMTPTDYTEDTYEKSKLSKLFPLKQLQDSLKAVYMLTKGTEVAKRYGFEYSVFQDPSDEAYHAEQEKLSSYIFPQARYRVYDTLHMSGQSWGSAGSSRSDTTSYVTARFRLLMDSVETWPIYYGQVQFFFEHEWIPIQCTEDGCKLAACHHARQPGVIHRFAAMKWFQFKTEDDTYPTLHVSTGANSRRSRNQVPDLQIVPDSEVYSQPDPRTDIIPVHRLLQRWIPHFAASAGQQRLVIACPIPSSLHA